MRVTQFDTDNDPTAFAAPLDVANVGKAFGGEAVLHNVSLGIAAGRCLALLGPSGSGKSTLLNLIAGFERPDSGDIRVGGQSVLAMPPHRRNVGMVFQQYALFPHLSVAGNIAYPLVRRGVPVAERTARVAKLLETVQLGRNAHHAVQTLSGGQQQRVAIARALAAEPGVLLMDEPMGALDRALREQLQIDLKLLLQQAGATVVYVTHDQREALAMADTIAILRDGRVEQAGATEQLYANPITAFAARFLWAGANGIAATTLRTDPDRQIDVTAFGRTLQARWVGEGPAPAAGTPLELVVRAEDIAVSDPVTAPADALRATVTTSVFAGDHRALQLRLPDATVLTAHQRLDLPAARPGETLALGWPLGAARAFAASA